MGKVTVFSINGCPHCIKAKEALKSRNIPFTEINLSSYPDKRSDLLKLSNALTVPQIFFNEKHLGDAETLIGLLEQWDKDEPTMGSAYQRYEQEIKSQPDPSDPRLQPSTKEPVVEVAAPPRNDDDKIVLPKSEKSISVLEMTNMLTSKVPISNLVYRGKTYKHSITGHDFSTFLMKEFDLTKEEAGKFGLYLNKRKIISHVTNDHEFSDRKNLYFRLQPHHTPSVLNTYRVWTDRVDTNPLNVVSRLSKQLGKIFDRAIESDGNVNLSTASQDPDYKIFEEAICELQGISMEEMDRNTKTAFLINVYNLMIKYAQVKVGVPSNTPQRAAFFYGVKVNIGGEEFSFQELEHGILRSNSLPPYALRKVFAQDDKRLRLILDKVDPRIHFGLNCGARSCPPVKKFTAMDLEEELRIVALSFCEDDANIKIKESTQTLHCNTILKWYLKDFAPSLNELPKALLSFLNPDGDKRNMLESLIAKGPIKVQFNEYDWSSDVSHGKDFSKSGLKADEYSLKTAFFG